MHFPLLAPYGKVALSNELTQSTLAMGQNIHDVEDTQPIVFGLQTEIMLIWERILILFPASSPV